MNYYLSGHPSHACMEMNLEGADISYLGVIKLRSLVFSCFLSNLK